jgi:hypothetical protein
MLGAVQTSGPPGGSFPGQPPMGAPDPATPATYPASPLPGPAATGTIPVPPGPTHSGYAPVSMLAPVSVTPGSSPGGASGPPPNGPSNGGTMPPGPPGGPSATHRMPTGSMAAVPAGPEWGVPSQGPPSMGHPPQGGPPSHHGRPPNRLAGQTLPMTPAVSESLLAAANAAMSQTGPHQQIQLPSGPPPAASSPQGLIPFPVAGATLTSSRGTYVVGQLIGDGQYGSVYECMGPFDQLYALKMLRPSNKPYQAVKDEWAREMQRLDSFRHPNIVYIHDAFEDNYLFYLALERCDTSLRNLARAPLHDALFLEISRQLLMALSYLHDSGLVHSDLHAGNVLVSQVDRKPIVKLTDFGVAHQLDGSTTWYRPQVANPKIIAPELLTAGYTTRQSDLYQLGLLMFQMHTGRPAIDVDRTQYGETTRMIAEGTPRALAEALNSKFSPVIAKLLRRRDAYRYQSAREVWDDLRVHARR